MSVLLLAIGLVAVTARGRGTEQIGGDAEPLSAEAARALESPIPYSESSIAEGELLYRFHGCAECHGHDGRALIEVVADATDLTEPDLWLGGTEAGSVFRTLRDGAGLGMPGYLAEVEDEEELWHLVNYVRSLWPEELRPLPAGDREGERDAEERDEAGR